MSIESSETKIELPNEEDEEVDSIIDDCLFVEIDEEDSIDNENDKDIIKES